MSGQIGPAETFIAGPGVVHQIGVVEFAVAIVIAGVIGVFEIGAFRIGDAHAIGGAHAIPCPLVDRLEQFVGHQEGGRGENLRRDEGHALDLHVGVDQHRSAIAPQELVELAFLRHHVPLVHPLREFLRAVEVVFDFVGADPVRNRALLDMQDFVLAAVFFEDALAGLDHQRVVPVVDAQLDALAGLQVPARMKALIVGAARDHIEIGQKLVDARDFDIRRAARRPRLDQRRRVIARERGRQARMTFGLEHDICPCMQFPLV